MRRRAIFPEHWGNRDANMSLVENQHQRLNYASIFLDKYNSDFNMTNMDLAKKAILVSATCLLAIPLFGCFGFNAKTVTMIAGLMWGMNTLLKSNPEITRRYSEEFLAATCFDVQAVELTFNGQAL